MASYHTKAELAAIRERILNHQHGDPAITKYIAKLDARSSKYLLSPEETRRVVDESMGDRNLSDIILEMRRERY